LGCRLESKSTSGIYQFLGNCLVPWLSKKQNSIALSIVETEYVIAGAYYALVLWMKHTLLDYDLHFKHIKIFCDNTSTINMTKNANHHSKTKHIEIRYHFNRDHFEKSDIDNDYVPTHMQLADNFTKPLDFNQFSYICGELNVCIMDN